MITLKQIFLVTSIIVPTFVFALTDDLIPGKHQILKDTKVNFKDNTFHQVSYWHLHCQLWQGVVALRWQPNNRLRHSAFWLV